jgi:hypothetical protein
MVGMHSAASNITKLTGVVISFKYGFTLVVFDWIESVVSVVCAWFKLFI